MLRGRPKKKEIKKTVSEVTPISAPAISENVIKTKNMDGIEVQDALVK